ncbi:hypothetical protein BJ508DRAFT_312358 [Ascobolus immersus RN42]|uniref:Uncharacterized protein n=1 Tax=Ascobolus immersus RN42 TaxID=1160509 RepID=A0A3N4HPU5_ASCIM|nr:hypothetical protein BJ508DRAFT_312358 [Ascobolus immersus RN42]
MFLPKLSLPSWLSSAAKTTRFAPLIDWATPHGDDKQDCRLPLREQAYIPYSTVKHEYQRGRKFLLFANDEREIPTTHLSWVTLHEFDTNKSNKIADASILSHFGLTSACDTVCQCSCCEASVSTTKSLKYASDEHETSPFLSTGLLFTDISLNKVSDSSDYESKHTSITKQLDHRDEFIHSEPIKSLTYASDQLYELPTHLLDGSHFGTNVPNTILNSDYERRQSCTVSDWGNWTTSIARRTRVRTFKDSLHRDRYICERLLRDSG